ncbi:MAG: DNA polymerase II large subunit [Nanoarchaeota archaeon]|nr:DNA polymerase II large subunit [Nanoarchaeota archaeon]
MQIEQYFINLEKDVRKVYSVAEDARSKGLDPVDKVEIPLAKSMAEKCVGLIATIYPQVMNSGITERILELEKSYGKLDATVSFKIAEEVAKQKFCQFASLLQAIDAGIRIGFAYTTLGVVSSPIEGFTEVKLAKTRDGKDYLKAYFSGPIRSSGTTASCIVLMLIDYLRELFGYAKYDPTEDEIKRYIAENYDYHERVTNLQYLPLEKEIDFLARHLPIQICGEPTEKFEVSNYKNLERIETNNLRGGMCLVFSEGLAQKAAKGLRLYNGVKKNGIQATGFDFLKEYIELHEKLTSVKGKSSSDNIPPYIKDLVAGRPIFGHPSRSGALRFRYGRGRMSGFSATSLHPATMAITDNFIATGTQLKIEKPTKGCAVSVCDCVEGPIVKLFNGSVKQLKTKEEATKLYSDVEEIIYLGDLLVPFSDVLNRNSPLINPGYVEEWWNLELKSKGYEGNLNFWDVDFYESIALSKKYSIPLYPKNIFYWSQINKEQFNELIVWLKNSQIRDGKIVLPFRKSEWEKYNFGKRALELLGVEHDFVVENVVLSKISSKKFFTNIGLDLSLLESDELFLNDFIADKFLINDEKNVLEKVNELSEFVIKDKAGDFIGTRMGRPEKAKLRKLIGSPNVLFPVGNEGGRLRSVHEACKVGKVRSSFPLFYCEKCGVETIYLTCEKCGNKCVRKYYYRNSDTISLEKEMGDEKGNFSMIKDLDINHYFNDAVNKLKLNNLEIPVLIKGVRGLSSDKKIPENLMKGILRAKYGLQVNKDGTIRYDVTELPLTAFKPKEVGVSVAKLCEIGYNEDIYGMPLKNEEQILELFPHDILLPSCLESPDEKADDVFLKTCNFIDELLVKFYGVEPIYNVKKREDLVGKLGVCMAPHNCAGVICRFVGFSGVQGLVASPYMHAAMRRDCDGDEAAIMLLSDVLINFSREFLPSHRGGTQDAPLVLNARIEAGEVDEQILDLELVMEAGNSYPLELYIKAEQRKHSSEVESIIIVKKLLKQGKNPFIGIGFTHDTNNFNEGVNCSSYKLLGTMKEKVEHQMALVEKIRAVDTSDVARLIIERHFIRDLKGNLRKFSMQGFRCVNCNEIMRRPPLSGVCPVCKGKIIFTIHEGGIKKYLDPAMNLIDKYNLSPYIKQSVELVKRQIDSIFGKELEKQENLKHWF